MPCARLLRFVTVPPPTLVFIGNAAFLIIYWLFLAVGMLMEENGEGSTGIYTVIVSARQGMASFFFFLRMSQCGTITRRPVERTVKYRIFLYIWQQTLAWSCTFRPLCVTMIGDLSEKKITGGRGDSGIA